MKKTLPYFLFALLVSVVAFPSYAFAAAFPTVTLTASPNPVNIDSESIFSGITTLTWSSTNATSCSVTEGSSSGFSTGGRVSGSDNSDPLSVATTFAISCTGAGGTATVSVLVGVAPVLPPTATLTAFPTHVDSGDNTTLTWSSTKATSCSVTQGASRGFSTGGEPSGNDNSSNLTNTTTFAISCTGAGGTATDSVVVYVIGSQTQPPTATLTASPNPVDSGDNTTLIWSSTDATSCSVTQGSSLGFSTGDEPSGNDNSSNLTDTTTFAISCTGEGGIATDSVIVNIDDDDNGGGGGGGGSSDDPIILLLMEKLIGLLKQYILLLLAAKGQ